MKQEDKELLLKDLCGRLQYVVFMGNKEWNRVPYQLTCDEVQYAMMTDDWDDVPYLRPMSSMTTDEKKTFANLLFSDLPGVKEDFYKSIDYLDSIHIDYRGLIEKGLALKAEEGMYKNV